MAHMLCDFRTDGHRVEIEETAQVFHAGLNKLTNVPEPHAQRVINDAEAKELRATADAVAAAIAVDDFSPEELAPRQASDAAPLQWTERARQTQSVAGGGA